MKDELGYDSDLVVDDEDEERLDQLPELKREQEIEERRQKRLQLIERYKLIQRQKTTTTGNGANVDRVALN